MRHKTHILHTRPQYVLQLCMLSSARPLSSLPACPRCCQQPCRPVSAPGGQHAASGSSVRAKPLHSDQRDSQACSAGSRSRCCASACALFDGSGGADGRSGARSWPLFPPGRPPAPGSGGLAGLGYATSPSCSASFEACTCGKADNVIPKISASFRLKLCSSHYAQMLGTLPCRASARVPD